MHSKSCDCRNPYPPKPHNSNSNSILKGHEDKNANELYYILLRIINAKLRTINPSTLYYYNLWSVPRFSQGRGHPVHSSSPHKSSSAASWRRVLVFRFAAIQGPVLKAWPRTFITNWMTSCSDAACVRLLIT